MKTYKETTKTDLMQTIYGTTKFDSFEYDTALPNNMIECVLNELFPDRIPGSEENAQNYVYLHESVYCYGKYMFRGEGVLPLTHNSLRLYNWYLEKTGINLIYTPTIDTSKMEQE